MGEGLELCVLVLSLTGEEGELLGEIAADGVLVL